MVYCDGGDGYFVLIVVGGGHHVLSNIALAVLTAISKVIPTPPKSLADFERVVALEGESCDAACAQRGKTCRKDLLSFLNE